MEATPHLPYCVKGPVVKGFGRGSKQLGIPTANYPEEIVNMLPASIDIGIYCGWAKLHGKVYKMVISIGWNPFYHNEKKSMETHIMHKFENDFYGEELEICIVAYLRPERNFDGLSDLVAAIEEDIRNADTLLNKEGYKHCF